MSDSMVSSIIVQEVRDTRSERPCSLWCGLRSATTEDALTRILFNDQAHHTTLYLGKLYNEPNQGY